jgi:hypothetical protein
MAIVSEGVHVFIVSVGEISSCLWRKAPSEHFPKGKESQFKMEPKYVG